METACRQKAVIRRWKSGDLQTESSDSQVEIRRLADRKQETRRWKSGDWQKEAGDSKAEIKRLAGGNCTQPPNQINICKLVYSSTPMQAKLPKPRRKLAMAVLEAVAEDLVEEETDPGAQLLWAPGCSNLSFNTMQGRIVLYFRATTLYTI